MLFLATGLYPLVEMIDDPERFVGAGAEAEALRRRAEQLSPSPLARRRGARDRVAVLRSEWFLGHRPLRHEARYLARRGLAMREPPEGRSHHRSGPHAPVARRRLGSPHPLKGPENDGTPPTYSELFEAIGFTLELAGHEIGRYQEAVIDPESNEFWCGLVDLVRNFRTMQVGRKDSHRIERGDLRSFSLCIELEVWLTQLRDRPEDPSREVEELRQHLARHDLEGKLHG
jgi:hypothetical protein